MFDALTGRLGDIFDRLKKRAALSEEDVAAVMREVRVALLEADVALPVVKDFVGRVRERAVGVDVLRSITPAQQVIKIVHDELVAMLGAESETIDLAAAAPVPVLMVGLQGSGKTTTTAKIALRLKDKERKRVLMASLDVRRPAAQEQLRVLGEQAGVATLAIVPGQLPVEIAKRAMETGRLEGYDVVLLDTAGRLSIDEALMDEVAAVRDATQPHETLLVVDAMTGQDAVETAQRFDARVALTGIVMTRVDGDARGGAALSMRAVTGKPIKLLGVGERIDALESFHPERVAGRILGMGDVVSLVEKAAETIDREEAERTIAKLEKGNFDLDDFAGQLRQMRRMGGLGGIMNMLPGVAKLKSQMETAKVDDSLLKRQEAIISSMTKRERKEPLKILNASRRRRIAAGSGTEVADVNRLLKQFQQMQDAMKQMKKLGKKGFLRQMAGRMPPGMLPPGGGIR